MGFRHRPERGAAGPGGMSAALPRVLDVAVRPCADTGLSRGEFNQRLPGGARAVLRRTNANAPSDPIEWSSICTAQIDFGPAQDDTFPAGGLGTRV